MKKALCICLIVCALALSADATTQTGNKAVIRSGFTVWDLWQYSPYSVYYGWPEFSQVFREVNNLDWNELWSLPVGIVIILPPAPQAIPLDLNRARLSAYQEAESGAITPRPPPAVSLQPSDMPSPLSRAMTDLAAGINALGEDFAELKRDTGGISALVSQVSDLQLALSRVEKQLDRISQTAVSSDILARTISPIENHLAQIEERIDWLASAEKPSTQPIAVSSPKVGSENDDAWSAIASISLLLIALFLFLLLILLLLFALGYLPRHKENKYHEDENGEKSQEKRKKKTSADSSVKASEIVRSAQALSDSYGYDTENFKVPDDLRHENTPSAVPILRIGYEDKEGDRVPILLPPCFLEKGTQPILKPNLPNHLRHCLVCAMKLNLHRADDTKSA